MEMDVFDGVFYPTHTSKMFIDYFEKNFHSYKKAKSILDLGCGCGVVSVVLKKKWFVSSQFFASDISEVATQNVAYNCKLNSVEIVTKSGASFEPWGGSRFDIIIDDVSGVAQELAKKSSWFGEEISCNSGADGTELTIDILEKSKDFLNEDGVLFFPALTLSNYKKI